MGERFDDKMNEIRKLRTGARNAEARGNDERAAELRREALKLAQEIGAFEEVEIEDL